MRPLLPLLATLASALLYAVAFPPAELRWLAWVALVPFLVALRRVGPGIALLQAWIWTVVAAYGVGDWFPRAVSTYYDQPAWVGLGFFVGVSTLMAAVEYAAFAACYRALAHRFVCALPLLGGAAWVGAELGRTRLLGGNPWALLGYSQVGADRLTQIADVAGVYGISFVLAAVNVGLAEVWLAGAARADRRRSLVGLGLAGAAAGCVLAYGTLGPRDPQNSSPAVTVAVVQGNVDVSSQWREDSYGKNFDVYLRLTQRVATESKPAVVFWPESAMTFFLPAEPPYQRAVGRLLGSHHAELVAGGPRFDDASERRYYNSAFLVRPDGTIAATYDKQRPLPFAEQFPLAQLDFMRRRFGRVREFAAGGPSRPLPTAAGGAGLVICNEAFFPELAAERARAGAGYLVNLSNDSWLGDPKFAAMALDMAVLRAVEQRRWLVRASTSGPSAIVDPRGRVRRRTRMGAQETLAGAVQASTVLTTYCRVGDLFAALCVASSLLAAGSALRRSSSHT